MRVYCANPDFAHCQSLRVLYSDCWIIKKKTHLPGGEWRESTNTLEQCKTACIDDKTCIAIDWDPFGADQCLSHDTSDATVNTEPHENSTLYQLNRGCLG